ncbi:hypothetical protein CY0110_19012 [Crocosphaera chwakensis CCY0110]|uniref:Uncharacterized protein n=1 Tax=Crocosphaera chwakensis CCY0110 TaxID=391612 RepID=A3IJD4_9CHRO|nr:hypothetical protein CY0110_19012 [Crocosphaera chwakensis CCY0110]
MRYFSNSNSFIVKGMGLFLTNSCRVVKSKTISLYCNCSLTT